MVEWKGIFAKAKKVKRMKKLNILMIIVMIFSCFTVGAKKKDTEEVTSATVGVMPLPEYESAGDLPGWAKEDFEILNRAGIIPLSLMEKNLSGCITRLDFSKLLSKMYMIIGGVEKESIEIMPIPYDDCDDEAAAICYSLGLMSTAGEGIFDPTGHITREEMTVSMISLIERLGVHAAPTVDELAEVCIYSDFSEASGWAYNAITRAVSDGYISGSGEKLLPHEDALVAHVIAAAGKIFKAYSEDAPEYEAPKIIKPESDYEAVGDFRVETGQAEGAYKYYIIVKDANYESVVSESTLSGSVYVDTDYFVDGELYTVFSAAEFESAGFTFSQPVVITYKKPDKAASVSSEERAAKYARAFSGGEEFKSYEEASGNMCSVKVPVWRLKNDGSKSSDTISLTVNKNLAGDIVAIFTEIYNDESKFPIKDAGCFNWRNTIGGAQSQHSFGTCIDINSNENYYISAGGMILSGSLWKPGENPYSIEPDSVVVKTFKKYGWYWGGDCWGDGYAKDYMHMTYLGG